MRGRRQAPEGQAETAPFWRRRETRFLALFFLVLAGGFTLLSLNAVNDHLVEPFTAGIARVSGVTLALLGQDIERTGTILRTPEFAVNIRNGCNGLEAVLIFLAAILAFPAPWKARLAGLALGLLGIQLVNLVRVVALFLTGAYFPALFDASHTVIWQSVVILSAVVLWLFWASRFARPQGTPA